MPIYEYRCGVCQERFEQLVRSMAATTRVVCPKCGSETVTKEWSVFGVGRSSSTVGTAADGSARSCAPAGT